MFIFDERGKRKEEIRQEREEREGMRERGEETMERREEMAAMERGRMHLRSIETEDMWEDAFAIH